MREHIRHGSRIARNRSAMLRRKNGTTINSIVPRYNKKKRTKNGRKQLCGSVRGNRDKVLSPALPAMGYLF